MTDPEGRWSKELRDAQQDLSEQTVEALAGKGRVRVVMSGTQECRKVVIDPELAENSEELAQLVQLAVNQAIQDSQLLAARRLSKFSDQLDK